MQAALFAQTIYFPDAGRVDTVVFAQIPVDALQQHFLVMDTASAKGACSCPFFPKPCWHLQALGLLAQSHPEHFQITEQLPEWAADLLAGKSVGTAKNTQNAQQKAEAAEKRRFDRLERAEAGFEELDTWLNDLLRRGLAVAVSEDPGFLQNIAARMADASMPGLSRMLRLLAAVPPQSPEWPQAALDTLGLCALSALAFRQRAQLPDALLADLQQLIGITAKKEAVMQEGEQLHDLWWVAAVQSETLEDRLEQRRTWLLGAQSGRYAMLLEFAFGGAGFSPPLRVQEYYAGTLVFYPSAFPLRALPHQAFEARTPPETTALRAFPDWDTMLDAAADAWGKLPWLHDFPARIDALRLQYVSETAMYAVDINGKALPLSMEPETFWRCMAASEGRPQPFFGVWDGRQFILQPNEA